MSRGNKGYRVWSNEPNTFDDDYVELAQRERVAQRAERRDRKLARTERRAARGSVERGVDSRRRDLGQVGAVAPPRLNVTPAFAVAAKACGTCRNWLADGMPGGRGSCDHPGSGFLHPYSDTPACPFFDG